MMSEYPYHQNEDFAALFREGFANNRSEVISENNKIISSTGVVKKIKHYMIWLLILAIYL